MNPGRRLAAEAVGSAFLLAAVVGSGIMGEQLAQGNEAITLLANSLATGAALLAILLALGPVSGAHLNPAVSLAFALRGALEWRILPGYIAAQLVGAVAGVWATHAMFNLEIVQVATKARAGGHLVWSEFIATIGLIGVICFCSKHRGESTPAAVAAYITAAYWFTSSTSFANPAVTIARSLTDTFTGIAPAHIAGFLLAQLVAAGLLGAVFRRAGPAPGDASGPAADSQGTGGYT